MSSGHSIITTSAPAKVILFGEHSVVYGANAIAASINRRTCVTLIPNDSQILRFRFEKISLDVSLDKDNPTLPTNLNRQQTQALECGLTIYEHVKPLKAGIDVTVTSDFPLGAGLGSSASLSVALSSAIIAQKFRETGEKVKENAGEFTESFAKNVLEASNLCEKMFHGNPSGIDTATSFLGGIIQFKRDTPTKKIAETIPMKLVIVDSTVERQTSAIVSRLAALRARFPSPTDHIFKAINEIALAAVNIISTDFESAGLVDLVRMNHGLLAGMGLSHPALEKIGQSVASLPVGFKLTGAGCGGNGIVFIPDSVPTEKVCSNISQAGFEPNLVSVGVPGLEVTIA